MVAAVNFMLLASILATLSVTAVNLAAEPASAHDLGYSSRDNNGNIRYREYSVYTDAIVEGAYNWTALGGPRIFRDLEGPVPLTCHDYNDPGSGTTGYWQSNSLGADLIYYNHYYQRNETKYVRKFTTTHEFGHALGFNHPFGGTDQGNLYYAKHSQLWWNRVDRVEWSVSGNDPGNHDINDLGL